MATTDPSKPRCELCGRQKSLTKHHLIPDEKELATQYNTKELLLANEAIKRYVAWVTKQK